MFYKKIIKFTLFIFLIYPTKMHICSKVSLNNCITKYQNDWQTNCYAYKYIYDKCQHKLIDNCYNKCKNTYEYISCINMCNKY